jgi:HNH endonuclease
MVVDADTGVVTEVGRTACTPSAALADLVRARDRTCRFPGCRQPAHRCDLDHVRRWPEGPTTADNLVALCRHHHRLKHRTSWTVEANGGEAACLSWTSPTGHGYTTAPPAAHAAS